MYLLWVFLFSINLLFFWFLNFFSLPGNWLIVGSAALFAYLFPIEEGYGLSWANVGTLAAYLGLRFSTDCCFDDERIKSDRGRPLRG
jgi:signal transduction histidine kinase